GYRQGEIRARRGADVIRFSCPQCGRAYVLADALAHLPLVCKGCGQRLAVPDPQPEPEPPPPPPVKRPVPVAKAPPPPPEPPADDDDFPATHSRSIDDLDVDDSPDVELFPR